MSITKTPAARPTRQEQRAITVERLIQAAGQVVARRGFAAASVDEIAEQAGFSRGAFYWNFAGKEAILLELLRRHMAGETAELRALLDRTDTVAGFAARFEAWAARFHQDADWALLSAEMQLLARRDPVFAAEYGTVQAFHRAALADLLAALFARAGKTPPVPAGILAAIVKALVQGLSLQDAALPGDTGIDAMQAMRLLLGALLSAASPA